MDEYISKHEPIKEIKRIYCTNCDSYNGIMCKACEHQDDIDIIEDTKVADVQSLSVVAEHIKNRLYETAFNTTEEKTRNAIADMAGRIDFWIDELKGGEHNDT